MSRMYNYMKSSQASHLQIQHAPNNLAIEIDVLKQDIRNIEARLPNIHVLRNPTDIQRIAYKMSCSSAYGNLAIKNTKLAKCYYATKNFLEARKCVDNARRYFALFHNFGVTVTEYNKLKSNSMRQLPPLEDLKHEVFKEEGKLYYLVLQQESVDLSFNAIMELYLNFIRAINNAKAVKSNSIDNDHFLFMKISFLFILFQENHPDSLKALIVDAENYLETAKNRDSDEYKTVQYFYDQSKHLENMTSGQLVFDDLVPDIAEHGSEVYNFYANVFLKAYSDNFHHPELANFDPKNPPKHLEKTADIQYKGVSYPISLDTIYRFLAHFRNITPRFRFSGDPELNNKVHEIIGTTNSTSGDINQVKNALVKVYEEFYPGYPDIIPSVEKILDDMEQQKRHLRGLYDGLAPEIALMLMGSSIERVIETKNVQSENQTLIMVSHLLEVCFNYRHRLRQANNSDDVTRLASDFINTVKNSENPVVLEINTPSIANIEDTEEDEAGEALKVVLKPHALFLIFDKVESSDGLQVRIRIVNGGFGASQYHPGGLCQEAFLSIETQEESLFNYLTLLFSIKHQVTTFLEFSESFDLVYQNKFIQFKQSEHQEGNTFQFQVTGNCTVFGAQWAFAIALQLNERMMTKLDLDFYKGCDLLAHTIMTIQESPPAVDNTALTYKLHEGTLYFPCGYSSLPRSKMKPPKGSETKPYHGHQATKHHVIPQSYLQFLYQELHTTNPDLLSDVLGRAKGDLPGKKAFVYGNFALFHGPSKRSDDPEDSKNDLYGGIEKQKPVGFHQERWDALQTIGTTLKTLLTDTPANFTGQSIKAAISVCEAQLNKIAADPSRIHCFEETKQGEVWSEPDQKTNPGVFCLRT